MRFRRTGVASASSAVACFLLLAVTPLASSPAVLKHGDALYRSHCAGCHGSKGRGDGPEVDRKDRRNRPANLTMSRSPEDVVFNKIWNGRKDPDMPAFKSRMTKDEVQAVVAFVLSLRP